MKIRDSHATINGDPTEYEMPSGSLDIIAEDGRSLFSIRELEGGVVEIHSGCVTKHGGVLLDDRMYVIPRSSNQVFIQRPKYR